MPPESELEEASTMSDTTGRFAANERGRDPFTSGTGDATGRFARHERRREPFVGGPGDGAGPFAGSEQRREPFISGTFAPTAGVIPSLPRVLIVRGVLSVIVGAGMLALLLWRPMDTLVALGLFAGAFFLVVGIMRVIMGAVAAGMTGGMRALNIVFGVLVGVLGLLAMINPGLGLLAMAIIIGVAWIFEGVAALSLLPPQNRGLWIFFAIVSLLAGLVIIAFPWASVGPLVIVTGVFLLVFGVLDLVNGARLRERA
jgi:uncharacterized membrane protein HdeD (DUF308 family)